jgi:hypothetical protein
VKSQLTDDFLVCFLRLPEAVKSQARKSYQLWRTDPSHPSLKFKRIHRTEAIYSCRISRGWRALGLVEGDTISWFWIGSHSDYELLLKRL